MNSAAIATWPQIGLAALGSLICMAAQLRFKTGLGMSREYVDQHLSYVDVWLRIGSALPSITLMMLSGLGLLLSARAAIDTGNGAFGWLVMLLAVVFFASMANAVRRVHRPTRREVPRSAPSSPTYRKRPVMRP